MKKEIMEHIQNLEKQGINVETNIDQINNLIDKIFNKKGAVEGKASNDIKNFLDKYKKTIYIFYNKNKISTETINKELIKYYNGKISLNQFTEKYNEHKYDIKNFNDAMDKKKGAISPNQKNISDYYKELQEITKYLNPKAGSGINKEVKILNMQQMFSRLPILLAQIQAGNNSQSLKNELRQLIYSLYRSKALTKNCS